MTIENFLNKEGKIKAWPSKQAGKVTVVRYLANLLDTGRFYTEKEINAFLEANHTFGDYFLLRREMVDRGALRRTPDGARYWRGGLWAEAGGCETERLTVREASQEDAETIGEIYRSGSYLSQWTGMEHDEASLTALLGNADLPPGGSGEFSHLAVLREKRGGEAVGICQYYTAWPEAACMWVGLFLLRPERQRMGYGAEFVSAFLSECARQKYRAAGLGVALRNAPALKFWTKLGFDRIVKVLEDGEGGVKAMLSLSRAL